MLRLLPGALANDARVRDSHSLLRESERVAGHQQGVPGEHDLRVLLHVLELERKHQSACSLPVRPQDRRVPLQFRLLRADQEAAEGGPQAAVLQRGLPQQLLLLVTKSL